MKREEKIFLVVFAAVLLCVLGVALSLGSREPSVKIRFSQASLSTNGHLTLNYSITQSSHTLLREIESIDDRVAIVSQMGNGSWIGLQTHGEGREEKGIMRSGASGASLLVRTDIAYNVTFTNHLVLYNFTNTDGVHYQSDFRMEKL